MGGRGRYPPTRDRSTTRLLPQLEEGQAKKKRGRQDGGPSFLDEHLLTRSEPSRRASGRRGGSRPPALRTLTRGGHTLRASILTLTSLARRTTLPSAGRGGLGRKIGESIGTTPAHRFLDPCKGVLNALSLPDKRSEDGDGNGPLAARCHVGRRAKSCRADTGSECIRTGCQVITRRLHAGPLQRVLGPQKSVGAMVGRRSDPFGRNALRLPLTHLHLHEVSGNTGLLRTLNCRLDTRLGRRLTRERRRNRADECDQSN
jgi:hypothetical protein